MSNVSFSATYNGPTDDGPPDCDKHGWYLLPGSECPECEMEKSVTKEAAERLHAALFGDLRDE